MCRELRFEYEECQSKNAERRAEPSDGEHGQSGEAKKKQDRADRAWKNGPRDGELGINPQCAQNEQQKRDIRIGDGGENLLAKRWLEGNHIRTGKVERLFTAIEAGDLAPVELPQQRGGIDGDHIDQMLVERLCLGIGDA